MSTVTAKNITDKAWIVVQDNSGTPGVRWPTAEMLGWVNDATCEVVLLNPQAGVTTANVAPVAGTRQTLLGLGLPDGIRVLDVPRNMTAAGVAGQVIRITPREALDTFRPGWHTETGSAVSDWVFDLRDPKSFYVYPALNAAALAASAKLEVVYSKTPTPLTSIDSVIAVDDMYRNCILNYVLFRAYSKDSEAGQNAQLSQAYYQLFLSALTAKTQLDAAERPVIPAT